jgi:hypothetical protein
MPDDDPWWDDPPTAYGRGWRRRFTQVLVIVTVGSLLFGAVASLL